MINNLEVRWFGLAIIMCMCLDGSVDPSSQFLRLCRTARRAGL